MKPYSFYKQIIVLVFWCFAAAGIHAQHYTAFTFVETASPSIQQAMQTNANAVFRVIHEAHFSQKGDISLSRNNATPDAIQRIQALWSTSKFYCRKPELEEPVLKMPGGQGWQVRNIPVIFVDGATIEDKYQALVLEFAPDGKLNDIYISMAMHQYKEIMGMASEVTDVRRRTLVLDFVENFRTAYNRKDLKYLESVFNNDALIITGKELKPSTSGASPMPEGVTVEYVTQNKRQYMERLKNVFALNSFINVKFDEIEVVLDERVARGQTEPHIYGVTLRQKWNSSSYNDEGWLFLMIDFKKETEPEIWVRTWQPLSVPRNKVFMSEDFGIK